jgi:hypothetical protein
MNGISLIPSPLGERVRVRGGRWGFRLDEGAGKSPSIPSPRRRIYEPEAFAKGGRF